MSLALIRFAQQKSSSTITAPFAISHVMRLKVLKVQYLFVQAKLAYIKCCEGDIFLNKGFRKYDMSEVINKQM